MHQCSRDVRPCPSAHDRATLIGDGKERPVPLCVWSGVAQVSATLTGAGRVDLYAVRRAGESAAALLVEAYDDDSLVAAGEVAVWELNQALAALMSETTQARRLAIRDDGRAHAGYLDVVSREDVVDVVATTKDGSHRVSFVTTPGALSADLNALLKHYLALTRTVPAVRTVVLPDVRQPASARAASTRPAP
jgi:hypothetical protein